MKTIQVILEEHNRLRQSLANGKVLIIIFTFMEFGSIIIYLVFVIIKFVFVMVIKFLFGNGPIASMICFCPVNR